MLIASSDVPARGLAGEAGVGVHLPVRDWLAERRQRLPRRRLRIRTLKPSAKRSGRSWKSSGSSKRAAERSVLSSRPAPNTAGGVTIASATASASASAGNVAAAAGAPAAGRRRDGLRARVLRAAIAPRAARVLTVASANVRAHARPVAGPSRASLNKTRWNSLRKISTAPTYARRDIAHGGAAGRRSCAGGKGAAAELAGSLLRLADRRAHGHGRGARGTPRARHCVAGATRAARAACRRAPRLRACVARGRQAVAAAARPRRCASGDKFDCGYRRDLMHSWMSREARRASSVPEARASFGSPRVVPMASALP